MKRRKVPKNKIEDVLNGFGKKKLSPVSGYLSTGCTILDLAIANQLPGGFAVGRISHIYGQESSTKTVLVCEPLGDAQRKGGKATFNDAENTFDFSRSHLVGLKTGKRNKNIWKLNVPDTIEELFDVYIDEAIEDADGIHPSAIGTDSVTALSDEVEMESDLGTSTYGTSRAKQIGIALRKCLRKASRKKVALIFVDQVREKIGVMFGNKDTYSGGRAIKFYASTQISLKIRKVIRNKYKLPIGIIVAFKVEKNKVAPPYREGVFRFLFDYGIDDIATNLEWIKENGFGIRKRGWYGFDKYKYYGLEKAVKGTEEAGLEKELQIYVWGCWKEVYKPLDRKLRRR